MKYLFLLFILTACASSNTQPSTAWRKKCFPDDKHPGQFQCYDWMQMDPRK